MNKKQLVGGLLFLFGLVILIGGAMAAVFEGGPLTATKCLLIGQTMLVVGATLSQLRSKPPLPPVQKQPA